MRLIPSTLIAVGAVAGLSGGVVAYQAVGSDAVVTRNVSDAPTPAPSTSVVLQPCDAGTTLEDGVCVLVVDGAVTPAPPATGSAPSGSAPRPTPTAGPTPDDDFDDDFDDDADDVGDDHGGDRDDSDDAAETDDSGHDGADDGADHDLGDDHGGDRDDSDDSTDD